MERGGGQPGDGAAVSPQTPLVHAVGLRRSYPLPDRRGQREVLRGVDLTLHAGEAILISGASGSGKTTLLSILAGLESPSAGSLTLLGMDFGRLGAADLTGLRRDSMGLCFQSAQLLPGLSARDNVLLPLLPRGLAWGPGAAEVDTLLETFGLSPLARARADRLSGGEQQRVALCRALVGQPRLLLFDEPAAHLDGELRGVLAELLRAALERGAGLLLTSHEGFGADWVDRHLLLQEGRLTQLPAAAQDDQEGPR